MFSCDTEAHVACSICRSCSLREDSANLSFERPTSRAIWTAICSEDKKISQPRNASENTNVLTCAYAQNAVLLLLLNSTQDRRIRACKLSILGPCMIEANIVCHSVSMSSAGGARVHHVDDVPLHLCCTRLLRRSPHVASPLADSYIWLRVSTADT